MKIIENIRENMPLITKRTMAPEEISELETALEAAFVPITPRTEFVERLNRQLITSAPLARHQSAPLEKSNDKSRESILIGAATIIGAAAIFATGFRVALTIIGMIGFLIQLGNRKSTKEPSPAQPVA